MFRGTCPRAVAVDSQAFNETIPRNAHFARRNTAPTVENRDWASGLAVALLLASTAVAGVAVPGSAADGRAPALSADASAERRQTAENNTTVRAHANPAESEGRANSESVERWLADRLNSQLNRSAVELSRGDYDRAKRLLGDDYPEWASMYAEVAGDRGGNASAPTERVRRIGQRQERFAEEVGEYYATLERYRAAKQNGSDRRARRLARRLGDLAKRVDRRGVVLAEDLRRLNASANLSRTATAVSSVAENVTRTQRSVRRSEFAPTQLAVRARPRAVSFRRPLVVTGRLTAENGTALSNRTVVLRAGDRRVRATTNGTGRFRLSFRPTTVPIGRQEFAIRYQPRDDAAYLGTNRTVTARVRQVAPTVNLREVPSETGFGRNVTVRGSVAANGTGAGSVPVAVSLGGRVLGRTTTAENGSFELQTALPADVPSGEQTLRARVALDGRALAGANGSAGVEVVRTATRLSFDADWIGENRLRVRGRLTTADGRSVADRRVILRSGDRPLGAVVTDRNGRFSATVNLPGDRPWWTKWNGSVELAAVYETNATNLEPAREYRVVSAPRSLREVAPAVGFVLAVLVVAVAVGLRRRDNARVTTKSESEGPRDAEETAEATPERAESGDGLGPRLATANELLAEGRHERAVETAYAAVRSSLTDRPGAESGLTHWEFYRTAREELSDDRATALRRLTEVYERAEFGPEPPSEPSATEALEAAATFREEVR